MRFRASSVLDWMLVDTGEPYRYPTSIRRLQELRFICDRVVLSWILLMKSA